jgi:polyisoprenyl-phosphate glycosyltransferase
MKIVSVVIPVFRNASTLLELYSELLGMFNKYPNLKPELIFVDDGSDDESLEIIKKLNSNDSRVQFLSFDINYGQVPAIQAGLKHCKGDLAVVMSADLQDPLEMIQEILKSWEAGFEVIICYRTSREDRWIDRFFSAVFYKSIRLIYPRIPLGGFDFFGLDRKAIDEFNCIKTGGRFLQGDVIQLNATKSFLPYERRARKKGKSQWTFFRKVDYALDAFFSSVKGVFILFSSFAIVTWTIFSLGSKWFFVFTFFFLLLLISLLGLSLFNKQKRVFDFSRKCFRISEHSSLINL